MKSESKGFDPQKLAPKELQSDSTDKFLKEMEDDIFALENDVIDNDEELKIKINNNESFILINKENLGEGSSRTIKLITELQNQLTFLEKEHVERKKQTIKNKKIIKKLGELKSVLDIMQNQYNMILIVLESSSDQILAIRNKFQFLGDNFIDIKSKGEICFHILELSANYILNNILDELTQLCAQIALKKKKKRKYLSDLKIIYSKLKTVVEILPNAVLFPENDIFAYEKTHPEWKELDKIIERKILGDPAKLAKAFKKLVRYLFQVNAILSKQFEQKNVIAQKLASGFGSIYYFFLTKQAQKQAKVFISDPNSKTQKRIWNFPDSAIFKGVFNTIKPNIEYNKKIYIDRTGLYNNKIDLKILFTKNEQYLPIRILSNRKINLKQKPSKLANFISNLLNKHSKKSGNSLFSDTLIIHIHGGGFISTSSRTHQIYTIKWANSLKIPVFAIDYRLAPEHPYPAALEDCFISYQWLINNVYELFDIYPKNIILIGDSAGGNLVCALTIKLIQSGLRVPDGLVLAYPALDLRTWKFTPSILLSLDDQIMPHTLIRLSINAYLGNNPNSDPDTDPLISPIIAPDDILIKFPPTRILVGTKDPLHDESVRFAQRLNKLKKDIRIIIYEEMPHGFLNYDSPKGMAEAKICVNDAAECIRELIYVNEAKQ